MKTLAEKINNWYLSSTKPVILIEVYLSIEGDKYFEFVKKYRTKDKYSWMSAKPLIPESCSIEVWQSEGWGYYYLFFMNQHQTI